MGQGEGHQMSPTLQVRVPPSHCPSDRLPYASLCRMRGNRVNDFSHQGAGAAGRFLLCSGGGLTMSPLAL